MFSGIEFHSGGGAGGNWGVDGWSHMNYSNALGGGAAEEHEIYETFYPHMLLYHRLSKDSGGPGRWRGGLGVEYAWVSETPEQGLLTPYADGMFTGIEGARGGKSPRGETERGDAYLVKADGTKIDTRKKSLYYYDRGDTFYFRSTGGGGVGDPLERDPEAVKIDVMNEMVSVQSAKEDYGVVFKEEKWPYTVDYEATEKLRKKLKGSKG
jgi:N-methylhydantoinase B